MTCTTEEVCVLYRRAIASGEHPSDVVLELAAMAGVQRPAIWKRLRAGGVLPPYAKRVEGGRGRPSGGGVPGYTERRRGRSDAGRPRQPDLRECPMPVDRDPCPRCGVRADYGCGHSRAPVGMVL